jgi:hypothetical protein
VEFIVCVQAPLGMQSVSRFVKQLGMLHEPASPPSSAATELASPLSTANASLPPSTPFASPPAAAPSLPPPELSTAAASTPDDVEVLEVQPVATANTLSIPTVHTLLIFRLYHIRRSVLKRSLA